MLFSIFIVITFFLRADAEHVCEMKFHHLSLSHNATHSACTDVTTEDLTISQRVAILNIHNMERSYVVENDDARHQAKNMIQMVWDDELEEIAKGWAGQCQSGHDAYWQRMIPGKYLVGQNIGWTNEDPISVVQSWADEREDFKYGRKRNKFHLIGRYTQMIWATTSRVGCGLASCPNTPEGAKMLVCNYGPAGNIGDVNYPYKGGLACSDCPNNCENGFCNCPGKACLNFGKMDLNNSTCPCKCFKKALFATGDRCELECDASSTDGCNATRCDRFELYKCPSSCGVCPYGNPSYVPTTETPEPSTTASTPAFPHASTTDSTNAETSASIPASTTPIVCQSGLMDFNKWTRHGETLALMFVDIPLTWEGAQAYCEDHFGALATPCESSNDEILQQTYLLGNLWIGVRSDGRFLAPNGDELLYSNWAEGGPNRTCAEMTTSGTWLSVDCTNLNNFVCGRDVEKLNTWANFRGPSFMFVDEHKTWREAYNHCQGIGGVLAAPYGEAENEWMTKQTAGVGSLWLGIRDDGSYIQFDTSDQEVRVGPGDEFENWIPEIDPKCGHLSDAGMWVYDSCTEPRPFVCRSNVTLSCTANGNLFQVVDTPTKRCGAFTYKDVVTKDDMPSYTLNCPREMIFDVVTCACNWESDTFCIPGSCKEWKDAGFCESGLYMIDPDGNNIGDDPHMENCTMYESYTTEFPYQKHTPSTEEVNTWTNFRGPYVMFVDERKTWDDASDYCRVIGGVLATPYEKFENYWMSFQTKNLDSLWIGVRDEGSRVHYDIPHREDGLVDNYSNWVTNTGVDAGCAYVNEDELWDLDHCSELRSFVCRKINTFSCSAYGNLYEAVDTPSKRCGGYNQTNVVTGDNMPTYTVTCPGDLIFDVLSCTCNWPTYSTCIPHNCEEWEDLGVYGNGLFMVDPDGTNVGSPPYMEECNMLPVTTSTERFPSTARSTTPSTTLPDPEPTYPPEQTNTWASYQGTNIMFVDEPKIWHDALDHCHGLGAILAIPLGQDENDWISSQANFLGSLWIGVREKGAYVHYDTFHQKDGLVDNFSNWVPETGEHDGCAFVSKTRTWDLDHCSISRPFVCRKNYTEIFSCTAFGNLYEAVDTPTKRCGAYNQTNVVTTANMPTYTINCPGDLIFDSVSCACNWPTESMCIPAGCEEWKARGISSTGLYLIDPDGTNVGAPPHMEECII